MPSDESRRLEALLNAAAAGERSAQQRLLATYWPVIVKAVSARRRRLGTSTHGRADTVDLQQDAALRILRELSKHQWQGRSAFSAWIRRLSGLEVIDAFRKQRAQKRDAGADRPLDEGQGVPPAATDIEGDLDHRRRLETLLTQLEKLKEEYGVAVLLHHLGFNYEEIGDAIGGSPEAARKWVSRGQAQLKKRLGSSGRWEDDRG